MNLPEGSHMFRNEALTVPVHIRVGAVCTMGKSHHNYWRANILSV
jgi:hypothetical protein